MSSTSTTPKAKRKVKQKINFSPSSNQWGEKEDQILADYALANIEWFLTDFKTLPVELKDHPDLKKYSTQKKLGRLKTIQSDLKARPLGFNFLLLL